MYNTTNNNINKNKKRIEGSTSVWNDKINKKISQLLFIKNKKEEEKVWENRNENLFQFKTKKTKLNKKKKKKKKKMINCG
jgi:hypothetical protein